VAAEDPTLVETLSGYASTALRTEDGTILPPTIVPNTGDRELMAALPQLDGSPLGGDLTMGRTIGEGGMGIIRLADQRAIGRQVAVKTLRPDRRDASSALLLLREAWVTGSLEHPNIVPIYSIGVDASGSPMIVMKRIEGTPWTAFIRTSEKDLRWHLDIYTQVANAVELAGSRGIIHRDLKPDNVMIGRFGEVYVLDWGIAVSLEDDLGGRIQLARDVRGVAGTPGYMAPEMLKANGGELSIRTDVYLLGSILHELITKEKRHSGRSLDESLLSSMTSAPYAYAPHVPADLAAIANRATHKDPEKRFADAGELRRAIERFLEGESSRRLTDLAENRIETWTKLGDRPDPVAVQNLFGEARIAFLEALRQWPENERAKRGLSRALERKFEHDIARDDYESAAVVLEEIGERTDLRGRLVELRSRMDARRSELDDLRRLQQSRNLDIGRRTRAFLTTLTAVAFGAIPPLAVVLRSLGLETGYGYFYLTSSLKLVDAVLLVVWARQSLTKTEVNKQITASILLLIAVEIGIRPFAQSLGHPIEHSLLIDFGIYFLVTATLAMTVDRRLAFQPLVYLIGAVLSGFQIERIYYYLGASHFLAFLAAAAVWRPATLRGPDVTAPRTP
jgi:serine/threonine-protein kinase